MYRAIIVDVEGRHARHGHLGNLHRVVVPQKRVAVEPGSLVRALDHTQDDMGPHLTVALLPGLQTLSHNRVRMDRVQLRSVVGLPSCVVQHAVLALVWRRRRLVHAASVLALVSLFELGDGAAVQAQRRLVAATGILRMVVACKVGVVARTGPTKLLGYLVADPVMQLFHALLGDGPQGLQRARQQIMSHQEVESPLLRLLLRLGFRHFFLKRRRKRR